MTPTVSRLPARGLYAITDVGYCARLGLEQSVAAALRGGARLVQYRDKGSDRARREAEVRALLHVCRQFRAPLIVNDDVELARACGADGVHVGRDDDSLARARARLGPDAIIGVSCYASLERAERAAADGASYVAFGAFNVSPTKPHAVPAPLELLHRARARLRLPIAAIGGIDADNAPPLIAAGADLLAVISAVFATADPAAGAARIAALCAAAERTPKGDPHPATFDSTSAEDFRS